MSRHDPVPTDELHQIARQAATLLSAARGECWLYTESNDPDDRRYYAEVSRVEADCDNPAALRFTSQYGDDGKVRVHGVYPRDVNYRQILLDDERSEPSGIGVTASRGPTALVAAIETRLMPVYLERLDRVRAEVARRNRHTEERHALTAELAAILDDPRPRFHDGSDELFPPLPTVYKVTVNRGDVSIELNRLAPDLAKEVLRLLTARR